MLNAVPRLDIGEITSYRETPEKFLDLYLTFSRVGPLVYQRADGSLETEYVTEDELFDEESLASACGKPITLGHPNTWVTADNARQFQRGSTSHKVIKDSPFVTILATLHDSEAIAAVKSGKARQISMGYTTKVVKKDDGKLYQTARRYNHAALVKTGRAGSEVKAHYDSLDSFGGEAVAVQVLDELAQLRVKEDLARQQYINRMSGRSVTAKVGHTQTKGQHMVITLRTSDAAAIALTNAAREQKTSPEALVLELVEEKYGSSEKPDVGNQGKQDAADIAYAAYVQRLKSGRR